MREYIGIDIGGTKCAVVRADENLCIEEKIKFDTSDVAETIQKITAAAKKLMTKNVVSAGISCGGPLDSKRGVILSPPNLPGWDNIEITKIISDALGVPSALCNDANACALAEWTRGAGRGCKNMVFLTFGTGMGAGLILDGKLYSGTNDFAGEVGHIRLSENGPEGYYKNGSFEGFCSGGGIAKLGAKAAKKAISKGVFPAFCKSESEIESISAKSIAAAADAGDKTAIEVYKKCGRMLGRGLSVIVDVLNPEMIVIGSIYQRSGKLLEDGMMRELEKEALPAPLSVCRIVPAMLGDDIGDIAAVSIAKNMEV
ncbi:MAG: ROK family protein [Clostridiales bacterium]|nr:ROK family protein [Clostridiales bacterium]